MGMYRKSLGNSGEQLAADVLERKGYRIVHRNFSCRAGEIDLIAEKDGVMHFVEVKTRAGDRAGSPAEAVTEKKQRRIRLAAEYYLMVTRSSRCQVSFDVVSVRITHDTDCF